MPRANFFEKLGFFVLPDFLEPEYIAQLRSDIEAAPKEKGSVTQPGSDLYVDLDLRSVDACTPPKNVRAPIKERLRDLQPVIERHFGIPLGGYERVQYLAYRSGDFFKLHKDVGSHGSHEVIRSRRVSVVIFLNRQSQAPAHDAYGDGELTFYGLLEGPQWEKCAFPLQAEPGLLIAFPSDKWHEVKPVSHGQRFTVVTWFYGTELALKSDASPETHAAAARSF
jgi:SM-20-related protein